MQVPTDLHPQGVDTPLSADLSEQIVTRKLSEIIIGPTINTRTLDPDVVEDYKDAMRGYGASWQDSWNELPRITETNHLWSGFHTLTAAQLVFNSVARIRCVIEGETERDAYFLATRTNAQHGRRRTNAEKQTSVNRWLEDEDMCQWTDSYIAKVCQVSTKSVTNYRRLCKLQSQPTKRKFINSAGDIEWMHTSRIGLTPPPAPDPQKQIKTDFKAYIKHRDAAYDQWESYCKSHSIPFDWDDFCQHAEPHLGRLVSLINPEDTTLDEIREKSQIWQKMKSAISHGASWVVSYRIDHEEIKAKQSEAKAEPIPAEEEGPDLQGLKEEIYDLLDNGNQIYAPALSNIHEVPLDVVETMIAQAKADWEMETETKRKQALMDEYDDLTSEGRAIWQKHLKRFISWKGLYDEAQSNWIALKDSMEYSPQEDSEESLKLQVAIWKNFKADLDYTVRAINNEGAERGNIWLLKLFVIDVESKPALEEAPNLHALREEIGDLLSRIGYAIESGCYLHNLATTHGVSRGVVKAEIAQALHGIKDSEPEQPAPLLSYPEDTDQQILNCKGAISELIEAEGLPLVIKFAAEGFLETIEKHLLMKNREDA